MALNYETVDVFTDTAFGGNPLAVVFGGEALSAERMQAIAAEFGYSETTFVLPPKDPANTAHVRIFTPSREVPFAGHPNVGTATVLGWRGEVFGKPVGMDLVFEEEAGLVPVSLMVEDGRPVGATLTTPRGFEWGEEIPVEVITACLGLEAGDIVTGNHPPREGSVGLGFIFVELKDRAALAKAAPNGGAFRELLAHREIPDIHCYVRTSGEEGFDLRTRMFAPVDGVDEDPATGSANAALTGLITPFVASGDGACTFRIAQGVEMGRPSTLLSAADYADGLVGNIRIGGRCVAMMRGELLL